jgi:hypothetical protein
MAIPISTWALVSGVVASAMTILFGRALINPEVPMSVVWLGAWVALFTAQATSWALSRVPQHKPGEAFDGSKR